MPDAKKAREIAWGAGWTAAVEKMRGLISAELSDLEERLRVNRQDFDDDHPAVDYVEKHITSLRHLASAMDIMLPGRDTGGGDKNGTV